MGEFLPITLSMKSLKSSCQNHSTFVNKTMVPFQAFSFQRALNHLKSKLSRRVCMTSRSLIFCDYCCGGNSQEAARQKTIFAKHFE